MLTALEYSVEFPSTGRSFQNRIEFEPGLTAITGRNEAGKTLVLEMIGYCLFGKAALRGAAGDYRNLTAELALRIGGQDIRIERRPRSEALKIGDKIEAVGAEAINRAVPKLLGFGLNVFNISCATQQGDVEALTNMRPTARKEMIDQVIGLNVLEGIERECRGEARANQIAAQALLANVVEPVEPVAPEGYEPSAVLAQKLAEVQASEAERAQLLRIVAPVAPEPPAVVEGNLAELEERERQRQAVLQDRARIEGQLAAIPEPRASAEDLARAVAYRDYEQECARRGPAPVYDKDHLAEQARRHEIQDLLSHDEVECPNCTHRFDPLDPSVDREALRQVPAPDVGRTEIARQLQRHANWSSPLEEVEPFTIVNIEQEIRAHARADERNLLKRRFDLLELPEDESGHLRDLRRYLQDQAVFEERDNVYRSRMAEVAAGRERLQELGDRSGEFADLSRRVGEARSFESLQSGFVRAKHLYEDRQHDAAGRSDLAEGFVRGAAALLAARVRVKAELAPSLSAAASKLLGLMTNGSRQHIVVDEDFNITVDGQPIQTLSGSGKAVVNLALRIGLGQVLTSKVLPLFLGDELDASMDQERAGATHATLQTLRQFLTQIILVTHKSIEADNIIEL